MHVSENKYATDSISNLPIIERGVRSDSTILLNIMESSECAVNYVVMPTQDARIRQARAKDLNLGVFVSYGAPA
jgi:hypothetical protein